MRRMFVRRLLPVVRPGRIFEPPPTSVLSLRRHVSTSHKAPPTEELQKAMDDFRRSQEDARTANERIKALEEQLQQMRESQDRRTPTPPDTAIDAVDSLFKWFGLDDFRVFVVWVAVTSTAILACHFEGRERKSGMGWDGWVTGLDAAAAAAWHGSPVVAQSVD
mmetsp:Transcript_23818/g.68474  ORF Transcript_23818/g.68474 Transcript_23818/m.68474 type:complete len:164 (-) Transcript_23818:67-558(-)